MNDDIWKVDTRTIKVVDSREPENIRTRLLELGWQQKRLYSADYAFQSRSYNKIGITRKETSDLITSINEIWTKQLEEMLEYYDNKIILLEGSWAKIKPSYVLGHNGISYLTWSMLWNYLRRWQDKGFTIELTVGIDHTIQRLNELYALYQKEYSLSSMTRKFTDDRVLAFPSGCRGSTVQRILDDGKSINDIANMSETELQQYDKIGEKKASLIKEHLNRRTKTDAGNQDTNNDIKEEPRTTLFPLEQEI